MNAQTLLLVALALSVLCGCTRAPQEPAQPPTSQESAPAVDLVAAMALPTPLFDLSAAPFDGEALARCGITLTALNDLSLLEFTNAGVGVTFVNDRVPTGNAPRSMLVTVRTEQPAPAVFVSYGMAGTVGHMFALGLDHAVRLFFWGYGADITCPSTAELSRWTCLVASYDGARLSLYKDGTLAESAAFALDTPLTPVTIGEKFVGVISDVRIWNTAMDATQAAAATATSLAKLR
jgi:hypothetical protein